MAQSLAKVYLHIVFSTKNRQRAILREHEEQLYPYLCSVCQQIGCPVLEIDGTEDHIHILLEFTRTITISKLLETMKANSSRWMKKKFPDCIDFSWQSGYGVFSVSESTLEKVKQYIRNQKTHHKKLTFKEEFLYLLNRAGIQYDEQYLWE
jgi:REP-associated tyrosine transposase